MSISAGVVTVFAVCLCWIGTSVFTQLLLATACHRDERGWCSSSLLLTMPMHLVLLDLACVGCAWAASVITGRPCRGCLEPPRCSRCSLAPSPRRWCSKWPSWPGGWVPCPLWPELDGVLCLVLPALFALASSVDPPPHLQLFHKTLAGVGHIVGCLLCVKHFQVLDAPGLHHPFFSS